MLALIDCPCVAAGGEAIRHHADCQQQECGSQAFPA